MICVRETNPMKSGLSLLLAFTFALLPVSGVLAQHEHGHPDPDAVKNGWIFNLEEGFAQAKKSGKPLMVVIRCLP
jgi:hypothetical protein